MPIPRPRTPSVLGRAAARGRDYARAVAQPRVAEQTKFLLDESQLPRRWYNIRADMPTGLRPVLHPGTGQPIGPDDLAPLFPMELILQEVSEEAEIAIPDEVRELYRLWRPTPLYRAHRLERAVGTRRRIFYKYEGVSPPGSHKPNTAVAQAFYNKKEGRTRIATETGAGQWGSSLAMACADRDRVQGLHGSDLVRTEAVPPFADGDLGRDERREPSPRRHTPAGRFSRSTRTHPAASESPSRRRSKTPPRARTPPTRSARCSTTCCCTRR